jgi:hypothetical protein
VGFKIDFGRKKNPDNFLGHFSFGKLSGKKKALQKGPS